MPSRAVLFSAFFALLIAALPALAQPGLGRALSCDGKDDYVSAVVPALPAGNSPYTIEVWINPATMKPGGIVAWGNYTSNQLNALCLTSNGFQNSWHGSQTIEAAGAIAGTWHHLAAVYDGAARRLYLDGSMVASNAASAHNVTTSGNFTIGKADTSFEGQLDELRIWNVARSAAQIQSNRLVRLTGSEPGLVAYWPFDEPSGTVTRDATTNRFRGMLVNRPRRVPSYWRPALALNGANPLTNANAVPFVDPGASIPGGAIALAIGEHHSVALKNDGAAVAWGYSPAGETTVPAAATNLIAITCGTSYTLALKRDGSLIAWGDSDASGQTNIPPDATNIVAVAAGTLHNLALTADGSLIGWGRNLEGQLNFPPDATNLVAVAAGSTYGLGLRADGTVIGWGTNNPGGAIIPSNATNVIAIEAGYNHSLALRADGTVVAWGLNYYGQATVPAGATNVVAIDASQDRSLAVRADGTMIAWGGYSISLNNIPAYATNVLMASAGQEHMLAVRRDGTIVGWGQNVYFQTDIPPAVNLLDLPITVNGSVNVNVFGPYLLTYSVTNLYGATDSTNRTVQVLPPWPLVSTLPPTTVINDQATLNGTVNPRGAATTAWFEWGLNTAYGSNTVPIAAGNGSITVPVSLPLAGLTPGKVYHYRLAADNSSGIVHGTDQLLLVPQIDLVGPNPLTNECHVAFSDPGVSVRGNPVAIAANGLWSVAVQADGRIAAWGNNTYGQLNINLATEITNVIAVDAGMYHGLALRADGTVLCWGQNNYNQTNVPASATNIVAISAGAYYNLALKADGSIIGWGLNTYGQATAPASATNVVAISAGGQHSLALRADGSVIAWGDNNTLQTMVPMNATNVIAISAGGSHSLALRADRTVIAWGYDYYGQSSIPANATNVIAISAGSAHNAILRADGTVIAWGDNNLGKANVPANATNVVAIAAGSDHNVALRADGSIFGWGYGAYGQTSPIDLTPLNPPIATSGTLDVNVPGIYTVTYTATNLFGGVGTAQRTVVVADTRPPVLTLLGDNPLALAVGSPLVDPGAVATDLCGGDLSAGIVISGTVDTNAPGYYLRTYTATDAYGNPAFTQRTVIVGLPAASTLPPSNFSGNSATLNGLANPRGVAATAWFEWGNSPAYGNQTAPISAGSGVTALPVNLPLNGLNTELNYHYRLVVSNSIGLARGQDQIIWWPTLRLNSANPLTNECHVSFTDTTTVNGNPLAIAGGGSHSLALKADGTVVAWGLSFYGSTAVPAGLTDVVAVDGGGELSLALRADGSVVGWGSYGYGETNIPAGLTNAIAISAGGLHALALKSDRTVVGWGYNEFGQTNIPVEAVNVVAISAGLYHSLALRTDGTVVAWGDNSNGQTNVPPQATNIVAIAAGGWHNLALRSDGTVIGWGLNDSGQSTIPAGVSNVVAVAAGGQHSLALKADGSVVAWGYNYYNQTNIPVTVTNVAAIAAGHHHNLALRVDGTIIGWGLNDYYQASIPGGLATLTLPITVTDSVDVNSPGTYVLNYSATNALGATAATNRTVVVVDTLRPVMTLLGNNPLILAVGSPLNDPGATATDLCAGNLTGNILVSGSVDTNTPGSYVLTYTVTDAFGNSTQSNRAVLVGFPLAVTSSASNLSGQTATLNGAVNPRGAETTAWFEWGTSRAYSGGRIPVTAGSGTNVVTVNAVLNGLSPGLLYHCRLVASNSVGIAYGLNQMFWLPGLRLNGLTQVTNQCHVAYTNTGARLSALVAAAGGIYNSIVLKADGRPVCWGLNTYSQTNVPTSASNIVAIAAHSMSLLALRKDGAVIGWGYNNYGEVSIPGSATNVMAIAAGYEHSLALRADGTVLGWGMNFNGQATIPANATNGVALAGGNSHSLLLKADGRIVGWGNNGSGQITVPVAATNIVAIAAGYDHSLALRADGRVFAWGANSSGQTNVPASASNVVAIAAGHFHNLALRADGKVVAWGRNDYGQTTVPTSATNVVTLGAGGYHSLAIKEDGTIVGWGRNDNNQAAPGSLNPLNLVIATNGSVDVNSPGTYLLTYSTTNLSGAVAVTNRTVIVADTLPPALSLSGTNFMMLVVGASFAEPGATATDLCAGDLTGSIVFGGTVDTATPGNYTLNYSVTDASGNNRTTNRTVVVVTVPQVTGLERSNNGTFHFSLANTPGARFRVLGTTNLSLPLSAWSALGPMVEGPPGIFQFNDPAATNWQRFYLVTFP